MGVIGGFRRQKLLELGLPRQKEFRQEVSENSPLAARMRPVSVDEFLGQSKILQEGTPLHNLLQGDVKTGNSILLYGPAGTGKTTLAYLIAEKTDAHFIELSAVETGVKEVKEVIQRAKKNFMNGEMTILFIDEIHRFNKAQQDVLLPAVENNWVILIAATTENPVFSINTPLRSRSLLIRLDSLSEDALEKIIQNAVEREGVKITDEGRDALIKLGSGDARKTLTILEASAQSTDGEITVDEIEKVSENFVKWSDDEHYDVTSAFIKSMRGSDPNATLHYLARMLEAGEDPRFIARRIMIAASEDVGLAQSSALTTATSAAQAVQLVGMPEAQIILSHAALEVAAAPKSNSAYMGIKEARKSLRKRNTPPVPIHLQDTHKADAETVGYQTEYQYSHDYKHAITKQEFLPEGWEDEEYYHPSDNGREKMIKEKMRRIAEYKKR